MILFLGRLSGSLIFSSKPSSSPDSVLGTRTEVWSNPSPAERSPSQQQHRDQAERLAENVSQPPKGAVAPATGLMGGQKGQSGSFQCLVEHCGGGWVFTSISTVLSLSLFSACLFPFQLHLFSQLVTSGQLMPLHTLTHLSAGGRSSQVILSSFPLQVASGAGNPGVGREYPPKMLWRRLLLTVSHATCTDCVSMGCMYAQAIQMNSE